MACLKRLAQNFQSHHPSISLHGNHDCLIITTLTLHNFYATDGQLFTLLALYPKHLCVIILLQFPSLSTWIITSLQNWNMARLLLLFFIILCLGHISSPLQTVPKHGSTKQRIVMDLSFPPSILSIAICT